MPGTMPGIFFGVVLTFCSSSGLACSMNGHNVITICGIICS